VAVPIFEQIIQAAWTHHAPRTPLRGPSAEARKNMVAVRADVESAAGARGTLVEYLRRDASGRPVDTTYLLVNRGESPYYDGDGPRRPERDPQRPDRREAGFPPFAPWGGGGWNNNGNGPWNGGNWGGGGGGGNQPKQRPNWGRDYD